VKTSEVLLRARALIEDPRNWTVGVYRVEKNGHLRHCAVGAHSVILGFPADMALRTPGEHSETCGWEHLLGAAAHVGMMDPFRTCGVEPETINDNFGHNAVLEMFDIAISMALSDEAGETTNEI